MSSFVSSILQHSANKLDDMPIIGSRSKRKSLPTGSSSNNAGVTHNPRIATGTAGPACYNSHNDYLGGNVVPPPPPYDHGGPTPTPSTSWTSEMSALADKIRDEQVLITSSKQVFNLDRKSISQGLKLVSIAADEYDEGNEAVALDIYLTGLDKILMALPNKTDPETKAALRDKLLSVEERVGILNLASQQKRQLRANEVDVDIADIQNEEDPKSFLQTYIFSRITSTIKIVSTNAETRYDAPASTNRASIRQQPDPVSRFKRFGQFVIHVAVTCAVLIKQSPIPDTLYFLFGYVLQVLFWLDAQYHIAQRAQDFGVECLKLLLQADEEYRLHEFISEALYMVITAGLKAVVAFKEAPSYKQQATRTRSTRK